MLSSGLAPQTPAYDMQRACGTSLSAAIAIGAKIAQGLIDVGIAGGVDTISDVPVVYPDAYRSILLLKSARGRSLMGKISPWFGLRPSHFKPEFPGVIEPRTKLSMGESMEITAKRWQITREEQDELALASHQNATKAWAGRLLQRPRHRVCGCHAGQQCAYADSSMEALAKLKPVFDRSETVAR